MSLRETWDSHAENWIRWARTPGHDSYWRFHRRAFLDLVPDPGRLTLDVGGGEGRVARDLQRLGHRVVEFDGSPTLARAAATHDESVPVAVADAARLPAADDVADLVVAFMSLQDIDDLDGAFGEAARVLVPGGRLCAAIVHPINSAGSFEGDRDDAARPFVMRDSYFEERIYTEVMERDGLAMTFVSRHRSLADFVRPLEDHGFLIERVREVPGGDRDPAWKREPMFLHLRAVKPSGRSAPSRSARRGRTR